MPSSRSAQTAAARTARSGQSAGTARARAAAARPAPRPRRVALRAPAVRVRWERVGRIALIVVLLAVVGLYGEHALSYVSTRESASRARATYVQLARQHRALEQQVRTLREPSSIIEQARRLGMTRSGEQSYAVTGQSSR